MRFPYSWLKEYIELGERTPEEVEPLLTQLGIEVDAIERQKPSFRGVVVGKILAVGKHPDADKLSLVTVTDGSDTYDIVCGAPNCREGMKAPFAKVGAILDDEGKAFKVKKAKIRGVESLGMLCSERELGISDEHSGILEFPEELTEGTDITDYFRETVFEVSLTPNLGHCQSVLGIARELAAIVGGEVTIPTSVPQEEDSFSVEEKARVVVEDFEACPRYSCRVITDVKIGPSPLWMRKRLLDCGVRSINNVVDITNYVLMEMGHPLHAFDYDRLEGQEVQVRRAGSEQTFVTLDDIERKLTVDDILICDKRRPVALGGVMGGQSSEVSDETRHILLESAYFDRRSIRRTSKRLGIYSESSRRFERGCDPNGVIAALDRAAALLQKLAGGKVAKGILDVREGDFPKKEIVCRVARVNEVLGLSLAFSEIEGVFKKLGFEVFSEEHNTFKVLVPTYRNDLEIEVDLIEEVARLYGYENIPVKAMRYQSSELPHAPMLLFEREIRSRLMGEGLQELLTCDLIGPKQLEMIPETVVDRSSVVRVSNPTSIDLSILRPSMFPGLLNVVKHNIDNQNSHIASFEVGRTYSHEGDQYREQGTVGIVLSGRKTPHHWDGKGHLCDFFDLKGIIENLLEGLGFEDFSFSLSAFPNLHTSRQAVVSVGDQQLGVFGEVHPKILRQLDIPQKVFVAELNLFNLLKGKKKIEKMSEIPVFPGSERDWTVTLHEEVPADQLLQAIQQIPSTLLESVTLRDVYQSETLGMDRKNITLRFFYRDMTKTISQERVDAEHERLQHQAKKTLGDKII